MAKAGRPYLNASRKRIETLGNESKTMSTIVGDSSGTSVDSGIIYIVTAAGASSAKTITLPPIGTGGQYVKIIWGVASDAVETIIATSGSDKTQGNVLFLDSDAANKTDDMDVAVTDGVSISVHDDIEPGSMIELLSNGTAWYIIASHIIATATPTVAT